VLKTLDDVRRVAYQTAIRNPDPEAALQLRQFDAVETTRTHPHPESLSAEGVAVFHPSGAQVKAVSKFAVRKPPTKQKGSVVKGRSKQSRGRLMRHLIQVDMGPIAAERKGAKYSKGLFVTLTYPWFDGKPFTDWERAKRDVDKLRKRIEYSYGLTWGVWVQEHQGSGALHFHLVLLLPRPVNLQKFRAWLSKAWYEVVGSGNPDHLRVGTRVDAVYINNGEPGNLLSYLSKELGGFGGKRYQVQAFNTETGEVLETGKTWGIWGREAFDSAKAIIVKLRISGREAWQRFKENVAAYFSPSKYLRKVADMAWWGGGLLYGAGDKLIDALLEGLPAESWEFVA